MLFIFGVSIKNIILFTICGIAGALVLVSVSIIASSLSFWVGRTEMITSTVNNLMVTFATYPDGIFKGVVKIIFYTILPLGITTYVPVKILSHFEWIYILYILLGMFAFVAFAFIIFYMGLRRYSSTNLMNARI